MGEYAGIWLRVSSKAQDEASQIPDITAWCKDHGYEAAKTYTLHGKSASKGEQDPMLREVLEDMRTGRIQVLVVWRLDRIERRKSAARRVFNFIGDVRDLGGRVEFTQQTYLNVEGPGANGMLANLADMAEEESRTKRERVLSGLATAKSNGAATTTPPWGYRMEGPKRGKYFVLEDDGRTWAPQIFQAVADGMSVTQAGEHFTEISGKRWTAGSISALIKNPTYKGTVVDGSGHITHRCEAAVDAAQWKRANLAASDHGRKTRGPSKPKAMLAGVLRCGECGAPMYRTSEEKGRLTRYYRCSASHGLNVPMRAVEAAVDRIAAEAFNAPVKTMRLVPGQTHDAEIEAVKFELQHLDLDAADYDDQHAELRARLAELKSLPSVPDRWVEEESGETYADLWATVPEHERAAWLKRHDFRIWATRERVTLLQGGSPWDEGWVPVADLLPALDKAGSARGRVAHTADV